MSPYLRALLDELEADPAARAALAHVLADYLPQPATTADPWLSTRMAAEYAGCGVDSVKKAMAAREVHFEQPTGPRGKAWFRRADIDRWRCGLPPVSRNGG